MNVHLQLAYILRVEAGRAYAVSETGETSWHSAPPGKNGRVLVPGDITRIRRGCAGSRKKLIGATYLTYCDGWGQGNYWTGVAHD